MPPVYLGTNGDKEKRRKKFRESIQGKMGEKDTRYNQCTLGAEFDITQPAMGKKIEKLQFSYEELVKIFKLLKFSDDEILKAMKGG